MSALMSKELREKVCAWLRANDVDPGNVPENERASIAGDVLKIRQAVLTDGHKQVDPRHPSRLLTEMTESPVRVYPDAEVARWLLSWSESKP